MKLRHAVYFGSLLLSACSHGQISTLPKVNDVYKASTVTVIREPKFMGGGVSYLLAIDEQNIAILKNGTYVEFKVEPGVHSLSFSIWQIVAGGWNVRGKTQLNCEAGQQYYIKFGTGFGISSMKIISKEEAIPLISSTQYLPLGG